MVCCWVVTRGSVFVWERVISVLRDEMFIGEVKQVNARDEGIKYRCINLGERVVDM